MTWKDSWIGTLNYFYGDVIESYRNHTDDRRLYYNTYCMILEAVKSLDPDPHIFVKVAMNKYLNEETELLKRIRKNFNAPIR